MTSETAPGAPKSTPLPTVCVPPLAPRNLQALLEEYSERRMSSPLPQSAAALKDAVGFTTRLYAGMVVAACRELRCLPDKAGTLWTAQASVTNAEAVLKDCLEALGRKQDPLATAFLEIFYEGKELRKFTHHLGLGPSSKYRIGEFCSREVEESPDPEEVRALAQALDEWMVASLGLFLECEDRMEPGRQFGVLELSIQFRQYMLKTGLAARVRESRAPTSQMMLAPSSPNSMMLAPSANPFENPEPAPAAPVSQIMLAPSKPSSPMMLAPDKPPPVAADLSDFVSDRLKQAPVSPRKPAKNEEPELPPEPQPLLDIEFEYMGFARSQAGKFGHSGTMWIRNKGEAELMGTVYSTNINVEILPGSFVGNQNRHVYWIDPSELPQPDGHIVVRSQNQERRIPISRLVPASKLSDLSFAQMLALLFAPGLLGCIYLTWVFYTAGSFMESTVKRVLGDEMGRFFQGGHYASIRGIGVGTLDLEVIPRAESAVLLFFLLAWLVPLAVAKIFVRFPRYQQKTLGWAFMLGMTFPVLYFMALWKTGLVSSPILNHPELAFVNFRNHMTWFALFNLSSATYLFFSASGILAERLSDLGRWLFPLLLFLMYALMTVLVVYGRSWFGA